MTRIRATCETCGDISLKNHEVIGRICKETKEGSYRFRCPQCKMFILKNAPETILSLLRDAGVQFEGWSLPVELFESKPEGEPITYDEIIDFYEFLEADGEI